MIAEILFPVALDKTFTYEIPEDIKDKIKPGIRIYASFSHRKKVLGYVISVKENYEKTSDFELKQIDKIIDEKPIFIFEKFIEISEYISRRWFSPRGLVLASFLRYLPVKFKEIESSQKIDLKNISFNKPEFLPLKEDILYIASYEKIKDLIFSILSENKKVVIFFPNIFALEIFKLDLLKDLRNEDLKTYTSSVTNSQKKQIVTLISKGEINLLLTTKVGVFLPFNPQTVFVILDPLNHMYRQFDQHPYYDTIDLIEKIAKVYDNRIVYVGHIQNVNFKVKNIKTFQDLNLNNKLKVVDIKKNDIFSNETIERIKKYLDENKKILIVSYSKYVAGLVFCPACKWIKKCQNCSRSMRVIEENGKKNYICTFCNNKEEYSSTCPQCGSILQEKGYGSQKIFGYLKNLFPIKKILEIDGRIIHSNFVFQEKLKQLKQDIDVLIGTEIILNSAFDMKFDLAILIVYESHQNYDYSYFERFMDRLKITQGLLKSEGEMFIYTFNPESYVFENLNNFDEIIKNEIELRKKFYYPPFCYFYEMDILSKDKENLRSSVNELIAKMDENFKQNYMIIDFNYKHNIRKLRGQKFYHHKSYIKLKEYEKFFEFLRDFANSRKLTIDIKSI